MTKKKGQGLNGAWGGGNEGHIIPKGPRGAWNPHGVGRYMAAEDVPPTSKAAAPALAREQVKTFFSHLGPPSGPASGQRVQKGNPQQPRPVNVDKSSRGGAVSSHPPGRPLRPQQEEWPPKNHKTVKRGTGDSYDARPEPKPLARDHPLKVYLGNLKKARDEKETYWAKVMSSIGIEQFNSANYEVQRRNTERKLAQDKIDRIGIQIILLEAGVPASKNGFTSDSPAERERSPRSHPRFYGGAGVRKDRAGDRSSRDVRRRSTSRAWSPPSSRFGGSRSRYQESRAPKAVADALLESTNVDRRTGVSGWLYAQETSAMELDRRSEEAPSISRMITHAQPLRERTQILGADCNDEDKSFHGATPVAKADLPLSVSSPEKYLLKKQQVAELAQEIIRSLRAEGIIPKDRVEVVKQSTADDDKKDAAVSSIEGEYAQFYDLYEDSPVPASTPGPSHVAAAPLQPTLREPAISRPQIPKHDINVPHSGHAGIHPRLGRLARPPTPIQGSQEKPSSTWTETTHQVTYGIDGSVVKRPIHNAGNTTVYNPFVSTAHSAGPSHAAATLAQESYKQPSSFTNLSRGSTSTGTRLMSHPPLPSTGRSSLNSHSGPARVQDRGPKEETPRMTIQDFERNAATWRASSSVANAREQVSQDPRARAVAARAQDQRHVQTQKAGPREQGYQASRPRSEVEKAAQTASSNVPTGPRGSSSQVLPTNASLSMDAHGRSSQKQPVRKPSSTAENSISHSAFKKPTLPASASARVQGRHERDIHAS
ncbi:MAG: Myelin expression factor 2, partial [Chaenotheca gracillima]